MNIKILPAIFMAFLLLVNAKSLELESVINKNNCDTVLNKQSYKVCYNNNFKGALFVGYNLDGKLVNKTNIKKRPRFYDDKVLPKQNRSYYSDYTHNIYNMDRGHLAPDAAFDYNKKILNSVYSMSNIIPQHRTVNRYAWASVENRARKLAVKFGRVTVLNGVQYDTNPNRIGKHNVGVPSSFWKMISNNNGYSECYYFENKIITNPKTHTIEEYQFDCSQLGLEN